MTIDTSIRKMILQLYDVMLKFVNGSSKLIKKQGLLGSKNSSSLMSFINRIAMKSAETSAEYGFTNMKAAEIKKLMEEKYEFKLDLSKPSGKAIFFLNMFVFGFMTECTSEIYTKIGSRLSDDAQRYLVYYIRIAIELNGEAKRKAISVFLQNGQCEKRFRDRCSTINEMKQEVQKMFQEARDYEAFNDGKKKNGTYKAHESLNSKDEIVELKEQMDRLKRENEALRTDLSREKLANTTLVKENTNLKGEIEYLRKEKFKIDETNRSAECELKEKRQDNAKLETQIKDMKIQMENLKREMEDKNMEIHTLHINSSRKEELAEPIDVIRDRLRDCEDTIQNQQREIMEYIMEHKNQFSIIQSLTDSRNKYRKQLHSTLKEMGNMVTSEKFCELRRELTERINQLTEDNRTQMRSIEKGYSREKILIKVMEKREFQCNQLSEENKALVEARNDLYEQGQQMIRQNHECSGENELLRTEIEQLKERLTNFEKPPIVYSNSRDKSKYRSPWKFFNFIRMRKNRA